MLGIWDFKDSVNGYPYSYFDLRNQFLRALLEIIGFAVDDFIEYWNWSNGVME